MGTDRQPKLVYTPSTWHLKIARNGAISVVAPPSSTGKDVTIEVCRVSCKQEDESVYRANASLIAGAPELLEIVRILKEYVDAGEPLIYFGKLSPHSDDVTLGDMVVSAMKKVEG